MSAARKAGDRARLVLVSGAGHFETATELATIDLELVVAAALPQALEAIRHPARTF